MHLQSVTTANISGFYVMCMMEINSSIVAHFIIKIFLLTTHQSLCIMPWNGLLQSLITMQQVQSQSVLMNQIRINCRLTWWVTVLINVQTFQQFAWKFSVQSWVTTISEVCRKKEYLQEVRCSNICKCLEGLYSVRYLKNVARYCLLVAFTCWANCRWG